MNTEQTILEPVMQEIGPEFPDIAAIAQPGEDSWAVQFANGASSTWRGARTRPAWR